MVITKNKHEENDLVTGHTIVNEPGFSWERRFFKSWGLIQVISGSGQVSISDCSIEIAAGDMLLTSPDHKYLFCSNDNWDFVWCHFIPRQHMVNQLRFNTLIPGAGYVHFEKHKSRRVLRDLLEAHNLELHRPHGWYAMAMLLIESALQRALNILTVDQENLPDEIRQAMKILTMPDGLRNIDQIAKNVGMSHTAFYRKFKQKLGCTPRQYREYNLLRRAQSMLENSDYTIVEIADQLGFDDQFYFSNRFKKFSGASPTAFRQRKNYKSQQ